MLRVRKYTEKIISDLFRNVLEFISHWMILKRGIDMRQMVKSKLINRFWMNLSILFGVVLFVAVMVCHPIFLNGALNQLAKNLWNETIEQENKYPTVLSRDGEMKLENDGDFEELLQKQQSYQEKWGKYLPCKQLGAQEYYTLFMDGGNCQYDGLRAGYYMQTIKDIEPQINIVYGRGLDDSQSAGGDLVESDKKTANTIDHVDGVNLTCSREEIPCLISTRTMDERKLVLGETVSFQNARGISATFKVVGIFEEADGSESFWVDSLEQLKNGLVVSEEAFAKVSKGQQVGFHLHNLLDYNGIHADNMAALKDVLNTFCSVDEFTSWSFTEQMKQYERQKGNLAMLLWVLEIPMMLLLICFLVMVSNISVKSELNEIAMLNSRGFSKGAIVRLYFAQSAILSFVGMLFGFPLGYGLCKCAASTDSFLSFSNRDVSGYTLVWTMLVYGVIAWCVATFVLTVPAYLHSDQSIVERSSVDQRDFASPFWQKFGLDIILVLASLYLLYNYNQQKESLALKVLSQGQLDPVVFIDGFLFLFGLAMLTLRLTGYLTKGICKLFQNRFAPATFASFLQITRTYKSQGFISIFLVVTVGMGVFHANLARTINGNGEDRVAYEVGADVMTTTSWVMRTVTHSDSVSNFYVEPDYSAIESAVADDVSSMTKVMVDDNAVAVSTAGTIENCKLMGISTKEFGETASLKDGLNDQHWYHALNALGQTVNGVIISRNLAEKTGIQVGDTISYNRHEMDSDKDMMGTVSTQVVAIVDAFPGYVSHTYETVAPKGNVNKDNRNDAYVKDEETEIQEVEHYLMVSNYSFVVNAYGLTPYQIWMKTNGDVDIARLHQKLIDTGLGIEQFVSAQSQLEERRRSPLIQITNGLYTLSFLVSLLLCLVGFFLYWIRSIKKRAMLFGVYRAMGVTMKEINQMLKTEQLFSSVLSMVAGLLSGQICTILFITLVATIYLPQKHCVPLAVYSAWQDLAKLVVVLIAMCFICFGVMKRLVNSMKLNESLKMGEDA